MEIVLSDSMEHLKSMPDNSVDSVVTDPPYEYKFMEKKWDGTGIAYNVDLWKEVYRVMKPGAYLSVFTGTRTNHRVTCAIEDAGFELRDMICWVYCSGMPKGQNLGKQIEAKLLTGSSNTKNFKDLKGEKGITSLGYNKMKVEQDARPNNYNGQEYVKTMEYQTELGQKYDDWNTTLKPAVELICLARKPLSEKTVADNVLKWGTGALNIGACRIEHNVPVKTTNRKGRSEDGVFTKDSCGFKSENLHMASPNPKGRFPSNVIIDEATAEMVDTIYGNHKSGAGCVRTKDAGFLEHGGLGKAGDVQTTYGDEGGLSRFFYVAKASQSERRKGAEGIKTKHPTVKPIDLIKYLVTLTTPEGGIVLDPFLGSGTTAIACKLKGFDCIGIEKESDYVELAKARLKAY